MESVDLNLLPSLDAFLAEGSVTGAARRLGLSVSAASRALARLRLMTGDLLLVRAGRNMVLTPRALAMRGQVQEVSRGAHALLGPAVVEVDPSTLERTFVIRASEGFVAVLGAPLVTAIAQRAPYVRLRFVPRLVKDAISLREGRVDLEIGVLGHSAPEVRMQAIFRDRFVGVARMGHPLLAGPLTPATYAASQHVVASRKSESESDGPVDRALAGHGLKRTIVAVVPGFPDALHVARDSDAIAQVPRSLVCTAAGGPRSLAAGLSVFELPMEMPEIVISAMWHPRLDAEPAHRWLRETFMGVFRQELAE